MTEQHKPATLVPEAVGKLFVRVAEEATKSGRFASVSMSDQVDCAALESAASAHYRVEFDQMKDTLYVGLVMADRWLSESIESQLVEHGDKMEDLLEDELVELDYFAAGGSPITKIEHYRSEDKLFTFRAKVPLQPGDIASEKNVQMVTRALHSFEACFRQLGDMQGGQGG